MAVTTALLLVPFALIGAVIYSCLLLDRIQPYRAVRRKGVRRLLVAVTYVVAVLILTALLMIVGLALAAGIIGLPVLVFLDVAGIVILVVRKIKKRST